MAADRGGIDGSDEARAPSADDGEAPPLDPRLWFLRDPAALASRLVLAEVLGAPRSRGHDPGHAPPTGKRR